MRRSGWAIRLGHSGIAAGLGLLLSSLLPGRADAAPTAFWASEPVAPGDVVLLYGGDLAAVHEVTVWRLPDADPSEPPAAPTAPVLPPAGGQAVRMPSLQPSSVSLKFVLPASWTPGVFAVDVGAGPYLIDRPRVDWVQSSPLLPGLGENQAAPGTAIQIIGRNFEPGGSEGTRLRVALRGPDGRVTPLAVAQSGKYSLVAALPRTLPQGDYVLWVHNGFGGAAGWGGGLRLRVQTPASWPNRVFNLRQFGARGDNVTDDSEAFRRALEAAGSQGGGVVYLPAGTYRLTGTFQLPRRVVVLGEGKDLTWLKWPQTVPKSAADFVPSALTGEGEFGIERLSLVVRNALAVLRGGASDHSPQADARARDVFLRQIRIYYLPYAGRPSAHPESDPQWAVSHWGIINSTDRDMAALIRGVQTLEVSDSEFIGTQRFLDIQNGRFTGDRFRNPMGVSWTDVGGEHIVFQGNRIEGAASWRPGSLPLRYIYGADNTGSNLGRGEREWFTFDVNEPLGRFEEHGGRVAPWLGGVTSASGRSLGLAKAAFTAGAYRGFDALIVSGRGAGQYRPVEDNGPDSLRVTRDWDVEPDGTSVVLLERLMGHCIFYRNAAEDVSVLLQVWGALYDCTFDGNRVARSQGLWGLSGWFIQWLDNRLDVAETFQAHVGPTGPTPEGTAEYGYLGFTIQGRLTSLGRFEYVRGAVLRGNQLTRGYRVLVMWGYGGEPRRAGFVTARDIVVDRNQIAHTPVGIELDANLQGAVLAGNSFLDVAEPYRLSAPENVLMLKTPPARVSEVRP